MGMTRFIELLEQLTTAHHKLNQLGKEKEQILIDSNLEQLESIIQKESMYVKVIEQLENERMEVTKRMMPHYAGTPTIQEVLPLCNDGQKEMLRKKQQQLLEQIEALQYQNALNQQLILDSLKFVNLSLDLAQPVNPFAHYSSDADDEEEELERRMFDTKA